MPYPVIIVPADSQDLFEQLGTKEKFWYADKSMLFKLGRPNTGENWAEVAASRICDLLRIPHAHYDFADFQCRQGVVCKTIVPAHERLVHANEPLSRFHSVASIQGEYDTERKYKQTAYSIRTVVAFLRLIGNGLVSLPVGWDDAPDGVDDPLGLFIGYLMLDALIANQDRHHENWGFIVRNKELIYMAPTYDHASSLGRNETDTNRLERLNTKDKRRDVEYYASRALAAIYSNEQPPKRLTTMDAFWLAAERNPEAGVGWIDRLHALSEESLCHIFANIPEDRITTPAIDFATKLMMINKERLLAIRGKLA